MEGYKIYNYQRDVLIQQRRPDGSRYAPIQDKDGVYFIFEQEYRDCGLGVRAEFIAPKEEPIEE